MPNQNHGGPTVDQVHNDAANTRQESNRENRRPQADLNNSFTVR